MSLTVSHSCWLSLTVSLVPRSATCFSLFHERHAATVSQRVAACLSLSPCYGCRRSLTISSTPWSFLMTLTVSYGCWLYLTVSPVLWSCYMSLTVSYCCLLSLNVAPSAMEFLNISHCLPWFLAVSHCGFGPKDGSKSLTISNGCWMSLTVSQVPWSCCMSLTVSYNCWINLTASRVRWSCFIFFIVSYSCLLSLTVSHCLYSPLD